jgi:hypothetical protein
MWPAKLIAYCIYRWLPRRLVTAPSSRQWMDDTTDRLLNLCLPVRITNQAGSSVLNNILCA